MRIWLSFTLVALSSLVALACGEGTSDGGPRGGSGGSGGGGLTCETLVEPPPGCDDACPLGSDSECELGTHCLNGACFAQCTATEGCNDNHTCNSRGRCVPDLATGGTGGTGNAGGNACQSVSITPTRSIPNVMFLVDQSGSMTSSFGGGENRWQAAHSAINAIVSNPLDDIVRFGLTTYTSRNGFQNGRDCPRLPTQIDFELDNSDSFANDNLYPYNYPSADGEDTPTGDSIDALVSLIQASPPPNDGPTIIVLATDGLPDSCECADSWPNEVDTADNYCEAGPPVDPRIEAVMAAEAAHAAGIDVLPLWVGDLDDNPQDPTRSHMQDVADAGVGGTGTVWVGDDPASLSSAFQTIISDSISCDVQMDKRFDDKNKACEEGDVRLDGTPLSCSDTNGWRVKPGVDDVIELVGATCDTFKSGDVNFSASFPCGAIIVE
jgi:hypothetical protein